MALTSSQIADLLFKKVATGKATSGPNTFAFFEESVNANKSVLTKDYWIDSSMIPTTNLLSGGSDGQILGIVKTIKSLQLNWIPGTFAFDHPQLKDIIPFNFGNGSYNYILTLSDGTTVIPSGTNDWYLDTEGGVLTFFNNGSPAFPTGVSTVNRPKITCWSYIGAKGNPVLSLTESTAGAVANNYILNSNLNSYSPNITYIIKIATNNTGISTININNLGTIIIKKNVQGILSNLDADDLKAGINYILIYDINNNIFQIESESGTDANIQILDISPSDWTTNGTNFQYQYIDYTTLKFKEIGAIQFYQNISGNNYGLVEVDTIINRATKTFTIISLVAALGHLRIVGGGNTGAIASTSGTILSLEELSDVSITSPMSNQTIMYDSTSGLWINSFITGGDTNISNTYFVDILTGNDLTGIKGDINKRFQNIYTAVSAATSGDIVFIFPGSYTDNGVSRNLFNPGVVIQGIHKDLVTYTASNSSTILFDDTNGSGVIKVKNMTIVQTSGTGRTITTANDNSEFYFDNVSLIDNRSTGQVGVLRINQSTSNCKIICNNCIISTPNTWTVLSNNLGFVEFHNCRIDSGRRSFSIRGGSSLLVDNCEIYNNATINSEMVLILGEFFPTTCTAIFKNSIIYALNNTGQSIIQVETGQVIKLIGSNIFTTSLSDFCISKTSSFTSPGNINIEVYGTLYTNVPDATPSGGNSITYVYGTQVVDSTINYILS